MPGPGALGIESRPGAGTTRVTVCAVQQGGVYAEAVRSERGVFAEKLEEKADFAPPALCEREWAGSSE